MHATCRKIVAEVLQRLQDEVRTGVTTLELDRIAEEMTRKRGAVPAFKGYRVGDRVFPASLCVSINEEVVHGIPVVAGATRGDIVGLDFGVAVDGYYGDAAVTVPVGEITRASAASGGRDPRIAVARNPYDHGRAGSATCRTRSRAMPREPGCR